MKERKVNNYFSILNNLSSSESFTAKNSSLFNSSGSLSFKIEATNWILLRFTRSNTFSFPLELWTYQPDTTGCVHDKPKIGIDEDVKWLSSYDKERLGYPTQKPEGILERMIRSSCPKKGLVLDIGSLLSIHKRNNITLSSPIFSTGKLIISSSERIEYDML